MALCPTWELATSKCKSEERQALLPENHALRGAEIADLKGLGFTIQQQVLPQVQLCRPKQHDTSNVEEPCDFEFWASGGFKSQCAIPRPWTKARPAREVPKHGTATPHAGCGRCISF